MRPPENLRDATAFLYHEENGEFTPIGSGVFLIKVEGPIVFSYLVTCKHVVKQWLDIKEPIYARYNLANQPGVVYRELKEPWYFHRDKTVDLAVTPINPKKGDGLERYLIGTDKLLTKAYTERTGHSLGVGDPVFFSGMFVPYQGYERNLPTYRFGYVSLLTDERLPGPDGDANYHLLEILAFPFNSGSPLFTVHVSRDQSIPGATALDYCIAGIVAGFFPEKERPRVNAAGEIVNFTHFGMSTVVPAEKVEEMLQRDELAQARRDKVRAGRVGSAQEPAGGVFEPPESLENSGDFT